MNQVIKRATYESAFNELSDIMERHDEPVTTESEARYRAKLIRLCLDIAEIYLS